MSKSTAVPASKKVAAKKVTPKKEVKKVAKEREVRIPTKGWGFSESTYKNQILPICEKNKFYTLSDFIRAAAKIAFKVENKD